MAEPIAIEVVYATPEQQGLIRLDVPAGSSLSAVLQLDLVQQQWPQLDLGQMPVGIFGKVVADPNKHVMQAGERIEIYRPLLADPKEVRRLRAAKAARDRAASGG
ncbi:RnfH family protein [Pseudomonas sp. dw_358]|uniref:RnfH family protein n=1 Tax=Pseudomonas sp. dw_358 TaxID=2720083 RepID=UPI001BD36B7E|nr:RnfH family protein [Pseudomonas sp. dw_358]